MTRIGEGLCLAMGGIAVFTAWLLMPDAATNDAAAILVVVAGARVRVHASALIQLFGAALLVPGVLGLARDQRRNGRAGPALLMWGAVGMAADAVFHQLAVQLTAPGVAAATALPVMERMQTVELAPHVPLLLAFLAALPVLGLRLRAARAGPAG